MAISKEEIAEMKRRVNIVDVIDQVVQLRKTGRNYTGLCPFHSEKTPSFSVSADKGFYRCFGCGKSGDVIRFIEDYQNVDFQIALKQVADLAGMSVVLSNDEAVSADNPHHALFEINNEAAKIYATVLTTTEIGQRAREYLLARGIDDEIIKTYTIGLSPDSEDFLYQNVSQKFDEQVVADSGLFNFSRKKTFDAFQNRLLFPIHNQYGQVVGFSGRIWQTGDKRPAKYVNTAATKIFDKSFELYNLNRAKSSITKAHEVYLMEGFMDVIAAHKAGIDNVVASMGTALTEQHVKRLSSLLGIAWNNSWQASAQKNSTSPTKKCVLIYDGDAAGQQAIYKALKLTESLDVSIIKVPDGQDPDEYEKANGPEALKQLMENARQSKSGFLMDYLRPANLVTVEAQLKFLQEIAPIIATDQPVMVQESYINRLKKILPDFKLEQIEHAIQSFRKGQPPDSPRIEGEGAVSADKKVYQEVSAPIRSPLPKISGTDRLEQQLLHRMLYHPELIERLSYDTSVVFPHKSYQSLYDALIVEQMATQTVDGAIDVKMFEEKLDEAQKECLYQVLSLDLPEKVTETEITDLCQRLVEESLKYKSNIIKHQLAQAVINGNKQLQAQLGQTYIDLLRKMKGC